MSCYFGKSVNLTFDDAISRVIEEQKIEGFGIFIEIDVKQTLKKKLDVDSRNQKILGACNPPFAYEALEAELKIGTKLPGNVIIKDAGNDKTEVTTGYPIASLQAINNSKFLEVTDQMQSKLKKVINSLH